MKKRLIKKWVNRYIKPLVKDLPHVKTFATNIYESGIKEWDDEGPGEEIIVVCQRQHIIRNGYVTPEGTIAPRGNGMRNNIKRTGEVVETILRNHNHVLLRMGPGVKSGRVYLRLITE